jgi:hypothetical protein
MATPDFYDLYPGLNPAVWKPLMFPSSSKDRVEAGGALEQAGSLPPSGDGSGIVKDVVEESAGERRRVRNSDFVLPCSVQREDGTVDFPEQERAGASGDPLDPSGWPDALQKFVGAYVDGILSRVAAASRVRQ